MSSTTSIWASLICILISRADAIKCLSCIDSARPHDCEYVQECGSHEKCFIQSYLTTTGYIRYNVSCMDGLKCEAIGRKRAVLNANFFNRIQKKYQVGEIADEQSDPNDVLLCAECCNTDLCNIKGCGEQGLPPNSGLLCYACEQETAPDKCNKITLCSRDSSCHLSTLRVGVDIVYKSGCIPTHECNEFGILDIGAYQLVGRRGADIISRFERGAMCYKCCSKNLCNSDNCTSLTHPFIIIPTTTATTTTQKATTLAPVNGGWSTWSHWNICSLTCGGGQHYRIRTCNNPLPANAGAFCSGSNREMQNCSAQPCAGDGQWSLWTTWSACSVTCGTGGISSRQRNCNNPIPSDTGKYCIGQPYEIHQCSGPNGPQVVQSAHNFTRSVGSQVVINCLVHGSFDPQQVPHVTWTVPQTVGHPLPTNLEQSQDGSLVIHGLTVENKGPYFCTLTTECGSYDSPDFYVAIY